MLFFIPRLSTLVSDYDAFLLDVWGVVHDGQTLYPQAREALSQLHLAGKKVVFLSNAPRRAAKLDEGFAKLGIAREHYVRAVCSGEVAWHWLQARQDPFFRSLGPRYWIIGPERDADMPAGLEDYARAASPEEADFVLCLGVEHDFQQLDELRPQLEAAQARRLPMLCVNPDNMVVSLAGERKLCAGAITRAYQRLGGEARFIGKPFPEIYAAALDVLKDVSKTRILAIGDTPETDLRGANAAGIDACLIRGGVLSIELPAQGRDTEDEATIRALLAEENVHARYSLRGLIW